MSRFIHVDKPAPRNLPSSEKQNINVSELELTHVTDSIT